MTSLLLSATTLTNQGLVVCRNLGQNIYLGLRSLGHKLGEHQLIAERYSQYRLAFTETLASSIVFATIIFGSVFLISNFIVPLLVSQDPSIISGTFSSYLRISAITIIIISCFGMALLFGLYFAIIRFFLETVEVGHQFIGCPTILGITLKNHQIRWEDIQTARYINLVFGGFIWISANNHRLPLYIPLPLRKQQDFVQQILEFAGKRHPLSIVLERYLRLRKHSRAELGIAALSKFLKQAIRNFLFLAALILLIFAIILQFTALYRPQRPSYLSQGNSVLQINGDENITTYINSQLKLVSAPRNIDIRFITRQLYQHFDDEFDFIFLLANNPEKPHTISKKSRYIFVKNTVEGIGHKLFDYTERYGSAGRLQGIIYFPYRRAFEDGLVLQALARRWGNYVLDTDVHGHWNYTGFTSNLSPESRGQLGGYDANKLNIIVGGLESGGIFTAGNFDVSGDGGDIHHYSDIELYLMGLAAKTEVGEIYTARYPEFLLETPEAHYFGAYGIEIKSAEELLPDRIPGVEQSQKHFRGLVVLLDDIQPDPAHVKALSFAVQRFSASTVTETADYHNFRKATLHRASIQMDGLEESRRHQ